MYRIMGKSSSRIFMIVVALLITFLLLPMTAFAATDVQDGLEVSITTDKKEYFNGDIATLNLSVTNTNDITMNNIKLKLTLPDGLKLQSGSNTINVGSLLPGASQSLELEALADNSSPNTPSVINDNVPKTDDNNSPKTEDNYPVWTWLLALFLCLVVVSFAYLKKYKATKVLSIVLCFMLLSVMAIPNTEVQAAVANKNLTVKESITHEGISKDILLKLTYDFEYVGVTGVTLDEDTITGWDIDEPNSQTQQLTATVAPADALYQDVIWSSSDTDVATVSDTGLITAVGTGKTTIRVKTEDGNYTDSCQVTIGSKTESNAEIDKITGFEEGNNQGTELVFNIKTSSSLTSGTTFQFVSTSTGSGIIDLGGSFSSGFLTLNTAKAVDSNPSDLNNAMVNFKATLNGISSDQKSIEIGSLFGTGTTVDKLKTDKEKVLSLDWHELTIGPGFTGSRDTKVILSSGVSLSRIVFSVSLPNFGGEGYMESNASGEIMVTFTIAPQANAVIRFNQPLIVCNNASYAVAVPIIGDLVMLVNGVNSGD